MPLNHTAAEFKPVRSEPIEIPLPDDPFAQDIGDIALSPQEAAELEEVQSWVEMMADFEESEGDHLIAMAMRYADKQRIHDAKHMSTQMGVPAHRSPAH